MKISLWDYSLWKLRLGLLVLMALPVGTYLSATSLLESANALADPDAISENLQVLRFNLSEIESAQRGYVLTGGEAHLVRYQGASNRLAQSIDALRHLTKDSPDQQERVNALGVLTDEQLDMLAKSIEERRGQGFDLNRQAVATYRAEQLMSRIQSAVHAIADEEEKVFAKPRWERNNAASKISIFLLVIDNLLALVIAASAVYRAETESALRGEAEGKLEKSQAWQEFQLQGGPKRLPATDEAPAGDHPVQESGRGVADPLLDVPPRR
jgi:CHASE3 domain sensor protein